MLRGPFLDRSWMGQNSDYKSSDIVMLGMPFDGTVSYRPGSRFAPEQIRLASWGLEEYSPYFDKKNNVEDIYSDGKKVFGIGGEHLVTLPEIQAVSKYVKNLAIVHFDAHTDLREEYLGEPLSHSAVIRHSAEIVGFDNLKQIGIRSGMKEEFELMKRHNTLIHNYEELDCLKHKNIFVTVDLDVLDTSIMPGTGTPEVGGLDFNQLMGWFKYLSKFNIVGADVVELAPDYDSSGASTAVATKVIRELLMAMSK